VAPDTAEAVRFAGGWLFDRAMAGWDAVVLTAEQPDGRAIRILGARAAGLACDLRSGARGPGLQAIAVAAELCGADKRVRSMVDDALARGAEVRLWGEARPAGLHRCGGAVAQRLSVAARAFKAQALAAAAAEGGASLAAEATEKFWSPAGSSSRATTDLMATVHGG
jgi:hypothetical protein